MNARRAYDLRSGCPITRAVSLGLGLAACLTTGAALADNEAAEEMRQRVGAATTLSLAINDVGLDGHPPSQSDIAVGGRAAYAFRVMHGFELGLDGTYTNALGGAGLGSSLRVLAPMLAARAYVPLTERNLVELGVTLRAGGFFMWLPDTENFDGRTSTHTWSGWGMSIGPDIRYWFSDRIGIQASLEVADHNGSGSDPEGAYLAAYLARKANLITAGAWVALLARL